MKVFVAVEESYEMGEVAGVGVTVEACARAVQRGWQVPVSWRALQPWPGLPGWWHLSGQWSGGETPGYRITEHELAT